MKASLTPIRLFSIFAISVFLSPVFVTGCAKSLPPPGGPPDETPPEFVSSAPASGAVNVSQDAGVEVYFSEPLDPQTVSKAVFITPESDFTPRIKTAGNRISIDFPAGLKADRTYVLTIGNDLRDAHRVSMAQSISIAFSTGENIDSGSIAGTVYENFRGISNISLALFEDIPDAANNSADSLVPVYLTQSGESGRYRFEHLPNGKFYVVAFEDKNKNRRINPSSELVGLPYREVNLSDSIPGLDGIDIRMHQSEPGLIELKSVSVNPDHLVKVRFNRGLTSDNAKQLFQTARIFSPADSSISLELMGMTNINPYPSTDFLLAADKADTGLKYQIRLDRRALNLDMPDSLRYLTYSLNFADDEDRQPPVILDSDPPHNGENIPVDMIFRLLFSEPIDTVGPASSIKLANCQEDTFTLPFRQVDLFTFEARLPDSLNYGCEYDLLIDEKGITDAKKNVLGDSTAVISFSTIGRDTLGQLSGEILFSRPEDNLYPAVIEFMPTAEGKQKNVFLNSGEKHFRAGFFPGYYSISAYLDKNSNHRYDFGSILPFRLAEPFTTVADTFRVRTRFETTGVEIEF